MTASALPIAVLWSYGIAAGGFVAFALRLALGWRSSPRAILLLAAVVTTASWAGSVIVAATWPGAATWLTATTLDTIRYAIWFVFVGSLLQGVRATGTTVDRSLPLPWWAIVAVTAGLAANVLLETATPFAPLLEPQSRTSVFGIRLGLAVFGLMLIEQLIRQAHPRARWALKPLCLGLAGVFAFDLYFFADALLFGQLDVDVWVARGVANTLVIPFLAVAAARNPGWTIEMHVSRGAIFHSTAILVSGVFLLAIAAAGFSVRYLGGEWGRALQVTFSFAALLVMALVVSSGSFRSKLRVFVSKHFFSYRYDYREEWLRFTRTLAAESSLQGVEEHTIEALGNLVESPAGALWLAQDGAFRPASRWNMPAVDVIEPASASLPRFLARTGWVINLTEYASAPGRYPKLELPDWLRQLPSAWLVIPLLSGADLIGFVVLATPRAAVDVNWEVHDLLKTASRQAASYLGQIRATEALLEARKFDAFNRMSAFVVHDLKNLVAQLSLMLKNAERHRDNPEFQRDMLTTVQHVVGRMNHLMLQLRSGETPVEHPRPTDLVPIVARVCAAKAGERAPIELDLPSAMTVIAHEDRLEHVIGHLVQNALDATAAGGRVAVRVTGDERFATVEVEDTGVGMTPEFVRDRLFKPFETSKTTGMGIGVYESKQYVAALGGQIVVDSTWKEGTRVRVLLPRGEQVVAPASRKKAVA